MATKVWISVSRHTSEVKKHSFKTPVSRRAVIDHLKEIYGIGDLQDQEGDSVITSELDPGEYKYEVSPPLVAPVPKSSAPGFSNDVENRLDVHEKVIKVLLAGSEYTIGKRSSDTYTGSNSTKSQPRVKEFKEKLLEVFTGNTRPTEMIECCITKLRLPSHEVVAGHIFPNKGSKSLQHICPNLKDVNDCRNGILWAYCIEDAYEESCIACKWNEKTHTLKFYVLDKNLLNKNMYQASMYVKSLKKGMPISKEEEAEAEASSSKDKKEIETELENAVASKIKELTAKGKERKRMRGELIEVCDPYVRALFSQTSFDSLHLQEIQFGSHVQLDQDAWYYSSLCSVQVAVKRGVLPDNFPLSELVPEGVDLNESPILSFVRTQPTVQQVGSGDLIDYVYRMPHYKVLSWLDSF